MIKINDLKKQTFDDITKLLGERWFDSHSNLNENHRAVYNPYEPVNVILADAVIVKAHTDGDIALDLGGRLATIPSDSYYLIEIF